jgi:hypothetical protein
MELIYRLEFNNEQQKFHLDTNNTHDPNSHGWVTVVDHCTNTEFRILEAYANRIPGQKITAEYLHQCLVEVKQFMYNLMEYNIAIISQ